MAKWHRSLSDGWCPEACQAVDAPKLARRLVPANLAGTNYGIANGNLKSTDSDAS